MDRGWISIHRSLTEKCWYTKSEYVHLWMHFLILANHKDNEFLHGDKIINVKRGQFITGRKVLAKATGISENKIRHIIKVFKNDQQIHQQNYNKFSMFSITNYDLYQKTTSKTTNTPPADHQQTTTNNKVNNVNNVNNAPKTPTATPFKRPSLEDVAEYCVKRNNSVSPNDFLNHYDTNGWMRGKTKIKDWKACVRTWEGNSKSNGAKQNYKNMPDSELLKACDSANISTIKKQRWDLINALEAKQ